MSVVIEWLDGRYIWKCKKHGDLLVPAGHSQGMGIECDPGMSHEMDAEEMTCVWYVDSSELACPTNNEEYTRARDDEQDNWEGCQKEWELVKGGSDEDTAEGT